MEELIEILINLISKLMSAKPPQAPSGHGGAAYKPIPGARALPASRAAVTTKTPPARRRRPQPPTLMTAPIITGRIDDTPPPPTIRTTVATPNAPAPTTKAPAALDAAAFRRWLTPATLRQQFMLTEIFQPPLAMREPREIS